MTSIFQLISPWDRKILKKVGASPSPSLQLGATCTPCPLPAARLPRRSGPGPPPCHRVTSSPARRAELAGRRRWGGGGRGRVGSDTRGGAGGAAAAPRPGKKPARCGFGARRQRARDSRPADQHHHPPAARLLCALAALRAAAPAPCPSPAPYPRPLAALAAAWPAPAERRDPRDPSASPAQPRRGLLPGASLALSEPAGPRVRPGAGAALQVPADMSCNGGSHPRINTLGRMTRAGVRPRPAL